MRLIALFLLSLAAAAGAQSAQFGPAIVANLHPRETAAPAADLVFFDFNNGSGFPFASGTASNIVSSGPTYTLTFTNADSWLGVAGGTDDYLMTVRFQVQGSPSSITNWSHIVQGGDGTGDSADLRVTLDAWTTGYGTGSHVISDSDAPVVTSTDPPDSIWPLGSGTITPNAHLWFLVGITIKSYDQNGLALCGFYSLTLNSP
jgi:hypothetical protein